MIWFYYFIIILLICPKSTTIVANSSSIVNQLVAGDAVNKCLPKEKQAILHFKDSLQDTYGELSTWRAEDDDCCQWSGVICNNQTPLHVTQLDLNYYFIGGDISSSLVNLTYLTHLDLSTNSFDGSIPNFIGSMTQLRYLDLSSNSFEGTIPKSIGSLTQLRYLDLSFNYFNGTIPPEFGNLTNLRNLSLGNYGGSFMFENLDWLSNLSHLQLLVMDGISLAKANYWIDVILSLPKLSYLSLWRCELSEVMHPSSSSSIQFLDLRNNKLAPLVTKYVVTSVNSC